MAKILSSRIKKVLHKVIDVRQSAFLEGRGIVDSVLVANEVLEDIKRRKSSCIFFKVDYEKAYDSIDWSFLFYMLERLGFCGRWVCWIRACLESSSVSVLVNGSPTQEFKPKKGVRQGDPLAPFLFLVVAEGLAGVVRMVIDKDLLESVEIGDRLTKVNMLQFADDTFFLCKASAQSVLVIKAILICFELASGLKVNFQKSSVGGIGCNNLLLQRFAMVLNCVTMKTLFKYLGMLVGGNHKRSKFWEEVVERVRRRLGRWKGKFISMAGRLYLPLFYMSLYKMPVMVANEIVRLQRNFLWGWGSEGRRIVWASWDKVCAPKEEGGSA